MYDKLHKHSFKNPIKARRYIDRYIKFIVSRIELNKTRGEVEGHIHHIVPRSWGGTNAKSNLVKLTYKEHIIAHPMSSSIYHARKRGSLVFSCGGYQWMMYDDYNNGE